MADLYPVRKAIQPRRSTRRAEALKRLLVNKRVHRHAGSWRLEAEGNLSAQATVRSDGPAPYRSLFRFNQSEHFRGVKTLRVLALNLTTRI